MSLATVASVVGIAAGANALFGGTGGGGLFGGTGAYTPSDQPGADTAWQQALQQEQGALGTQNQNLSPQYLSNIFQVNQQAMPNVQGFYNAAGQQLANESNVNSNAQNMQMGVGNTVWNTAQDPQNALYNQSLQQVQDQSRAASSLRGIGMGGDAAGLENQATGNFNIDWQNQQLARQAQGAQALGQQYQGAAQQGQDMGTNLTGAAGMYGAGMQLPYTNAQQYAQTNQQAITQPYGAMQANIMPYLNYGINSSQNNFGQQQQGLSNVMGGLGGLSAMYSASQKNQNNQINPNYVPYGQYSAYNQAFDNQDNYN